MAENATLIASTANGGLVATASGAFADLTYLINGEVFGGWDSYTEEVSIQIGSTGMYTVPYFFQMNQGHIFNAGTMASTTNLVISKYDDPSGSTLNDLVLTNTGSIVAGLNDQYPNNAAIDSGGALTQIFNSGEILASTSGAITVSSGDAEIANSGLIRGDVTLASGTDRVTNSGIIEGDVALGAGNDRYTATSAGWASGTINGGAGNDRIVGGWLDDTLQGGGANDLLRGRAGDDSLLGGVGRDSLFGNNGEDVLDGQNGDDLLYGGRDDDLLIGGQGLDTLIGGAGDDTLTGSTEADVFVFHRNNGDDSVTDFVAGTDLIDISRLGLAANDLTTLGTAVSEITATSTLIDFALLCGSGSAIVEGLAFDSLSGAFLF